MLAFKLLDENMQSCNGGSHQWQLNKPYKINGEIQICQNGFHLTIEPEKWKGKRFFIAHANGIETIEKSKLVCRRVILLKELSKKEVAVFIEARAPAEKAYNKAIAPARKAYDEARAPARKAYDEARAPAEKAYDEAIAPARKAYYEAIATAEKAYYEAIATAEKAYDEARAPAEKAYYEAMQPILKKILKEEP